MSYRSSDIRDAAVSRPVLGEDSALSRVVADAAGEVLT